MQMTGLGWWRLAPQDAVTNRHLLSREPLEAQTVEDLLLRGVQDC